MCPRPSRLTRRLPRVLQRWSPPILVLTNRTSIKGCSGIRCRIPGGRAAILVVEDQRLDLPDALTKLLARSFVAALFTILPTIASAQAHDATPGHADPVTPIVLALAVILTAAKFGGHLAVRIGQPAVLGELVAGVALGSLDLAGISWFHGIEADATVEILARLGVVILLFEVGLESTVSDMLNDRACCRARLTKIP